MRVKSKISLIAAVAALIWMSSRADSIGEDWFNYEPICLKSKSYKIQIAPQTELRVTAAAGLSENPAIAYDAKRGEFGIVWQDSRTGSRIDPSTRFPYPPPPYSVYFTRIDKTGKKLCGDILISDGLHDGRNPSIAWSPDHGQYLIAWQDARDCALDYLQKDPSCPSSAIYQFTRDVRAGSQLPPAFTPIPVLPTPKLPLSPPPVITVSIQPDKSSYYANDAIRLTITASCSSATALNKLTWSREGTTSVAAKTLLGTLAYYRWNVTTSVATPGTYTFNAAAYGTAGYGTASVTAVAASAASPKVTVNALTPCDRLNPLSWQIYVRRVDPSQATPLDAPKRITDPKENRTARVPSVAWNGDVKRFGLAWLEIIERNCAAMTLLRFAELEAPVAPAFANSPLTNVHDHNLTVRALVKPDRPSLAANGQEYAAAYEDIRPPYNVGNVYLTPIVPDDLDAPYPIEPPELEVSSAWEAGKGAARPGVIRTHEILSSADVPLIGDVEFAIGAESLFVTWEENGGARVAGYDPGTLVPLFGTKTAAQYGSPGVAPVSASHETGIACLSHDAATGNLNLAVLSHEGDLKHDGFALASPNPERIDGAAGPSGNPAAAWGGGAVTGTGVYGVAWEDGRFGAGNTEIYFRLAGVTDRPDAECDDSWVCAQFCDAVKSGAYVPAQSGSLTSPGTPVISVTIEAVSSNATLTADCLAYHIVAYSAVGSRLTEISWKVNGKSNYKWYYGCPAYPLIDGDTYTYYGPPSSAKGWEGRYLYEMYIPTDPLHRPYWLDIEAECIDANGAGAADTAHRAVGKDCNGLPLQ